MTQVSENFSASLVPLDSIDPALVEDVLDRAFGTDRHSRTAYRVREGTEWLQALSFAALDDDDLLVGTIQVWPTALTVPDRRPMPMLMVGPVAVIPERQKEGFGRALMTAMASAISPQAPLPRVLIGDPEYYGAFGFTAAPTQRWSLPGPFERHRLMVACDNPAILPEKGHLGPWIG